jgi:hypothetical protein
MCRANDGALAKCDLCNGRDKQTFPEAPLLDADEVRVIFLTAFGPDRYHPKASSFDPALWTAPAGHASKR